MSLDGPDVSEISYDVPIRPYSPDDTLPPIDPRHRRRKRRNFTSKMASSILRNEKKRSCEFLEKIIAAKQQAINDQQCKLDYLRSQMHALKEDNRMLKAQGHVQAAIIERLDGKHAKIPMLMNTQMEEIRVYREQLRRLKEIFMRTNKAMQESENARFRAEEELQHLRTLAFEQKLPEREELISALQDLKAELEAVEKDKLALEKYVQNLEKNAQCERSRLLRRQRELQTNCTTLANTVRGLQTCLQEKQRMLIEAHTSASVAAVTSGASLTSAISSSRTNTSRAASAAGRSKPLATTAAANIDSISTTPTLSLTAALALPQPPVPPPHLSKLVAKPKPKAKTTNRTKKSVLRATVAKKNVKMMPSTSRPSTTLLGVKQQKPESEITRPSTMAINCAAAGKSGLCKHLDSTLVTLKANENLARLVAEAKIKEELTGSKEGNQNLSNEIKADSAASRTTFVNSESCEDWPEFEEVEALGVKPLPRPVRVQSECRVRPVEKTGAVAARGDSLEVSELLAKLPNKERSAPSISTLMREVIVANEEAKAGRKTAKADESDPLEGRSQTAQEIEEVDAHKKQESPEPFAIHIPNIMATEAFDSNNTNSARNAALAATNPGGTRLASKLFDAHTHHCRSPTSCGAPGSRKGRTNSTKMKVSPERRSVGTPK